MFHVGGMGHGFGHFLRHVGFRKGAQRDNDLGLRLAQDGRDLFGFQQRVDRVHTPRRHTAQKRDGRVIQRGQNIGDSVIFLHAKAAKQVRGLRDAVVQFGPCIGFCTRRGVGKQLKRDRRTIAPHVARACQRVIDGYRQFARLPRALSLDRAYIFG